MPASPFRVTSCLLGVAALVALTVPVSMAEAAIAAQDAGCVMLQVQNDSPGALSTVVRRELPAGAPTSLGELAYHVNALGYSATQDLFYGVADRDRAGYFPDGPHVVTMDRRARVTDHGVLRRTGAKLLPWLGPDVATAGAVSGNRWYVRAGAGLYTVDIDPADSTYLGVVRVIPLRPVGLASLALGVDDFAVDPADGLLYGVSALPWHDGVVVRIDPDSGRARAVPGVRLPASIGYGAVVMGPDRSLYVTANDTKRRSHLYRVAWDQPGGVTDIAAGPPLAGADAAGCLVAPPTPAPLPPPASPPPPVAVIPASPAATPPAPSHRQPVPVPVPATSAAPPPPVSSATARRAKPAPTPVARAERDRGTATKRRWALTVLLLVFGAGAAARGAARPR